MLLVEVSIFTNRHRYEDIALELYGIKFSRFTSIMNLLCLLSFVISFIVYIKEAIIQIILIFAPNLDSFIVEKIWGQKFWCTIFCVSYKLIINSTSIVLRSLPIVHSP